MTDAPLFWIKQIAGNLEDLTEVPLWGFSPAFPFDACAEKIAKMLGVAEARITLENTKLCQSHEITDGLGANPIQTTIELTPLAESAFWLMGQEDVRKLSRLALSSPSNGKGFTTPAFQEGFYRFISLQIIEEIDELKSFNPLSLKIGAPRPLPKEEALCIDVGVHLPKLTLWGKIVAPKSFRQAFKEHFSMTPTSLSASTLAKEINVMLIAEVGQTKLPASQFEYVKVGDMIILDRCSFDPSTLKGTATLSLQGAPLLRARLKGDSLKIVDYAFYHEDMMQEHNISDEEEPSEEELGIPEDENPLWSSENEETPIEQHISAQDIQLSLTVEVARLKINLDKLLHLKPGNVLELAVHPEQGVDLSIGGKKVAKAELIKLGDIFGVKILHIGDG